MVRVAIIEERESNHLTLINFIHAQRELTYSGASRSVATFNQDISTYSSPHVLIIVLNEHTAAKTLPFQLQKIKEVHPNTEILILGDCTEPKKIIPWLKAGVVGYLPWHTPLEQLKEAVLSISQGGAYITPVIVRKMLDFFRLQDNLEEVLTEREKEIVQCLVEGMSYKLIAYKLNVALDTVRYHLRNIYKKLNVNSKAQVISKAVNSQG